MTITHQIYQIKKIKEISSDCFQVIQKMEGGKIRERTLVHLIKTIYDVQTELTELKPDIKLGIRIYTLIKR